MAKTAALSIFGALPRNVSDDARRVGDIVAALAPPGSGKKALTKKEDDGGASGSWKDAAKGLLPGVAGAVLGSYLFPDHWILGAVGGYGVGHAVGPVLKGGDERKGALYNLGALGAGVVGSLMWENHPFLGYLAGGAAGLVAVSAIPGSPTHDAAKRFLGKAA